MVLLSIKIDDKRTCVKAETKWPPSSRQHLQINNIRTFFQILAWRRPCDKPLSEPMMVSLLTHICVTRPQWVNDLCTKASKQLNAFTRFSKFLSFYSIKLVINNFNNGDYQYSSLVWHFCGHVKNNKIGKTRDGFLRVLYRNYVSSLNLKISS